MDTDTRVECTKGKDMKLKIDWAGLVKALLKAAWPFIAGAAGGIVSGCAWGGNGPNFML